MSRFSRFLAVAFVTVLAWSLPAGSAALATPTGWRGGGGVTVPTDYADYSTAIVGNQYQADIEQATELGLIVGHDDRTFRPNDNVTVGQFANIVARNYWQQGASEGENLAYLGSLGIDVSDPRAALTLNQLMGVSAAVEGKTGVAELAILGQVRDGSLVPSGSDGGITRGQAVDLLSRSNPTSDIRTPPPPPKPKPPKPSNPPPDDPPDDPPREPQPSLSAAITPNPAKRLQAITVVATVRNVVSATAQLPWQEISLTGGTTMTGSSTIPIDLIDGTYTVPVEGRTSAGTTIRATVQLTVRGSILDDMNFVITD